MYIQIFCIETPWPSFSLFLLLLLLLVLFTVITSMSIQCENSTRRALAINVQMANQWHQFVHSGLSICIYIIFVHIFRLMWTLCIHHLNIEIANMKIIWKSYLVYVCHFFHTYISVLQFVFSVSIVVVVVHALFRWFFFL